MDNYEMETIREFITLTQALKLLPNVAPNKTKPLIENAHHFYFDFETQKIEYSYYKVGKTELTEQELNEMWIEDDNYYGTTIRISPRGAKTLLKLYLNGDLILKKGKTILVTTDIPLKEYIDKETFFDAKDEERIKARIKACEHFDMLVDNPDMIKEEDFSYRLLDRVFIKNQGLTGGCQKMLFDGIEVRKSVSSYKSNSGKSKDNEVVISWTGSDGEQYELRKDSDYKHNRRNDSDRNWGLPE